MTQIKQINTDYCCCAAIRDFDLSKSSVLIPVYDASGR